MINEEANVKRTNRIKPGGGFHTEFFEFMDYYCQKSVYCVFFFLLLINYNNSISFKRIPGPGKKFYRALKLLKVNQGPSFRLQLNFS